MKSMMGARNTRGFSSSVESGQLPALTHLTYEGVFNELKFDVGKPASKAVQLHFGYARYQFSKSQQESRIKDYLAIFLKSSRDGADRDDTPINALICLDISGSMNGGLGESGNSVSRLKLSVEAIKMFISKLRPNDSVGLVTFNSQAKVVFNPIFKAKLDEEKIYGDLDLITAGGGTIMRSGFSLSKATLETFVKKEECFASQNRIIMLTDVGDNSISGEKAFLEAASEENGINTTIIGISTQFRSEVCENLKNVKGFNYFCAINQDDIKKYVFETFDFGFFPSAHHIEVKIQCPDINRLQVFGSPDSEQVTHYNHDFTSPNGSYIITRMKTAFPSELEIHGETVYTIGGLILVRLDRNSQDPFFKGQVSLSYKTAKGVPQEHVYEIFYQFHPQQQFFSADCLRQAVEGFVFTSELRNLLKKSKDLQKERIYRDFWPILLELEKIVPESKKKDLESVNKIVKGYEKEKVKQIK